MYTPRRLIIQGRKRDGEWSDIIATATFTHEVVYQTSLVLLRACLDAVLARDGIDEVRIITTYVINVYETVVPPIRK